MYPIFGGHVGSDNLKIAVHVDPREPQGFNFPVLKDILGYCSTLETETVVKCIL